MKKDTPKQTLTDKQEGFAVSFVMNGGDASAAYRENYNAEKMKDTSIWVEAHEVRHSPKVSVRIHELRMRKLGSAVISIDDRKKLLTEKVVDGDLKALEILNKMEGVYIEKVETKVTGNTTIVQIVEDKRDGE